jgi:hypothetical protein
VGRRGTTRPILAGAGGGRKRRAWELKSSGCCCTAFASVQQGCRIRIQSSVLRGRTEATCSWPKKTQRSGPCLPGPELRARFARGLSQSSRPSRVAGDGRPHTPLFGACVPGAGLTLPCTAPCMQSSSSRWSDRCSSACTTNERSLARAKSDLKRCSLGGLQKPTKSIGLEVNEPDRPRSGPQRATV